MLPAPMPHMKPIAWMIAGAILVEAIVAAAFFFASNYILKNRLNLE